MYIKDAAEATLQLANAPLEQIQMMNYLIDGLNPSVAELVDAVRERIPEAQISYHLDEGVQGMLARTLRPFDGKYAREEWDWKPTYDLGRTIDDFSTDLSQHPERFA